MDETPGQAPAQPIAEPKMFSRVSVVLSYAFFAFALLAVATPAPALDNAKRWATPTTPATVTTTITVTAPAATVTAVNQCNTGSIQCCQGVQSVSRLVVVEYKATY